MQHVQTPVHAYTPDLAQRSVQERLLASLGSDARVPYCSGHGWATSHPAGQGPLLGVVERQLFWRRARLCSQALLFASAAGAANLCKDQAQMHGAGVLETYRAFPDTCGLLLKVWSLIPLSLVLSSGSLFPWFRNERQPTGGRCTQILLLQSTHAGFAEYCFRHAETPEGQSLTPDEHHALRSPCPSTC